MAVYLCTGCKKWRNHGAHPDNNPAYDDLTLCPDCVCRRRIANDPGVTECKADADHERWQEKRMEAG